MNILVIGASGYIGSRICLDLSKRGWKIIGCDLCRPVDLTSFVFFYEGFYQKLPENLISQCDLVLWVAGHSSVRMAREAPWESVKNNVFDLCALARRLAAVDKPLIYASSASVLSSADDKYSLVANEIRENPYDAGKLAFDILAPYLGAKLLGLRFSTISGWSPQMRWDLVFNAMNKSAYYEGVVRVSNSSSFRSLLFIDDLCDFILEGLNLENLKQEGGAKLIPLATWSGTIGSLGAEIAAFWNVPIETNEGASTYSFMISDRSLLGQKEKNDFYQSIGARCKRFASQMKWEIRK
jgi:UDP-glucose 4-epimerase